MKFYNALLILAAAVTLTLGNGLDITDDTFDEGFGNSSDVEIDQNAAPIENPVIVPPSLPSMDNNTPADTSIPSVDGSVPADTSIPGVADSISGNADTIPVDGEGSNTPIDGTDNVPSTDGFDQIPDSSDGISGQNADLGNSSDIEYDNIQAPVDQADVSAQGANDSVPAADGNNEDSDDYGDSQPVDQIDNSNPSDQIDSTNTLDSADVLANNDVPAESSDIEDEGLGTGGKVAGGLAGAAVLSSAGLFYYVKRSKRAGLQSVRTQITMV